LGKKGLKIGGNSILGISNKIVSPQGVDIEVFDANGLYVVSGLIDNHVHFPGMHLPGMQIPY